MICLQNDRPTVRRVTRQIQNPNRSTSSQSKTSLQQTIIHKTKFALCFLCLFDGLRTPSIRRLVRKPRTICKKPLLTFDPSFYAPSSSQALHNIYGRTMSVPCDITVDPSVQTVLTELKKHGTSIPPYRLLIHYYGHGCYAPTSDSLFFFSDDRARYKPMKIINLIHSCACPLAFIFDCPAAAVLSTHLKTQRDIFAFFSCAADEKLPLSTDAPMDLFSSCLLTPYDTAIWWHMQRHSTVYDEAQLPNEENKEFLFGFLYALLDAIAFESQPSNVYEKFTADPTIAQLFKGFALAQRIMVSFNIHSSALPELNQMAYHPLWNAWDLAIDFCQTLPTDQATKLLYKLCRDTFESFESPGIFPILTYFLKTDTISDLAAKDLLEFIDLNPSFLKPAMIEDLEKVIGSLSTPPPDALLIVAKLAVTGSQDSKTNQTNSSSSQAMATLQAQNMMQFASSSDSAILKAGMLNSIVQIQQNSAGAFSKMTQICLQYSKDCMPYSALLLGLLVEKGGSMMGLHDYAEKFIEFTSSKDEVIRAAAVYVIGASNDPLAKDTIQKIITDTSIIVRKQIVYSLGLLYKSSSDKSIYDMILSFENDDDDSVKQIVDNVKKDATSQQMSMNTLQFKSEAPIILDLMESARQPGFPKRYALNVFKI